MGLFDRIFRPKEAKKSDDVVQNGTIIFKELNCFSLSFIAKCNVETSYDNKNGFRI